MTDPATPSAAATTPEVPVVPLPVAQSKSRLKAIVLWRDPKISAIVLAACMLFFYLTLVRGLSVLSVIGAFSGAYLILGIIIVNVNKRTGGKLNSYITRPATGTPLLRRETIYRGVDTVIEECNEVGEEIRDVLYCDKPPLTLGCAFVAFLVYIAGNYFSLLSVLLVGTIALFTLPLAYEKNKKTVDDAVARASDAAAKHIETGRKVATDRAVKLRDVAAAKSAPLLEKAPPVAKNLAEKFGLTPVKSKNQ
ncbi:unnamed protein product [Chondrus crispus]|uniref:Reticulon-like protein n=1 Tax=Chondrus crispus TaxID=2769 RepID=R7QUZ9_CHOCR|nr:unnamed protein product [Chondrus crispus]CDF41185.1 unnamed protein product [Chondrus crispus]|eukprot:XP_005711479.1 unnamed protein product [Chondrus crispus]